MPLVRIAFGDERALSRQTAVNLQLTEQELAVLESITKRMANASPDAGELEVLRQGIRLQVLP